MVKFGDTEIAKEKFNAPKRPIKIFDVNIDNIVISKLVPAKANSKYLIRRLDKTIRPFVLMMSKMSGYVRIFQVKEGSSKLMSFHRDDENLLEKYKAISTKLKIFLEK